MRRGGGVGNSSSLRLHDHTGLQRFFSISATLNPYVVARGGSVSASYLSRIGSVRFWKVSRIGGWLRWRGVFPF